jgi:hypothetical protein
MKKVTLVAIALAAISSTAVLAHEGKGGRMMERLRAADTNADGLISKAEAAALPRLAEHFDAIDANRDGQVSAEELRAARGQRHGKGQMFTRADADKDGKVSQQEFIARATERFQRLDANGDGFLTQDEARAGRRGHHGR